LAYDTDGLVERVLRFLCHTPAGSLQSFARVHRVDRHTVNRALKRTVGKSYRTIRREMQTTRLVELMSETPGASVKELASAMGYERVSGDGE
jgi:methylphosphotriester-DNA--protein-cysteine methyltransferase